MDKFLVSLSRYKGVTPYRAQIDIEKMVDMININDIKQYIYRFISKCMYV